MTQQPAVRRARAARNRRCSNRLPAYLLEQRGGCAGADMPLRSARACHATRPPRAGQLTHSWMLNCSPHLGKWVALSPRDEQYGTLRAQVQCAPAVLAVRHPKKVVEEGLLPGCGKWDTAGNALNASGSGACASQAAGDCHVPARSTPRARQMGGNCCHQRTEAFIMCSKEGRTAAAQVPCSIYCAVARLCNLTGMAGAMQSSQTAWGTQVAHFKTRAQETRAQPPTGTAARCRSCKGAPWGRPREAGMPQECGISELAAARQRGFVCAVL